MASTLLVVVSGQVSFGGDHPKAFVETFILIQEPGKPPGQYYISSDTFRMVSD